MGEITITEMAVTTTKVAIDPTIIEVGIIITEITTTRMANIINATITKMAITIETKGDIIEVDIKIMAIKRDITKIEMTKRIIQENTKYFKLREELSKFFKVL